MLNGLSPRGSPQPMLNPPPMINGVSPRGSPPMLNGLSPRGSPPMLNGLSPPPMHTRSSPQGSPRGSPPPVQDASTGDAQQADAVAKV